MLSKFGVVFRCVMSYSLFFLFFMCDLLWTFEKIENNGLLEFPIFQIVSRLDSVAKRKFYISATLCKTTIIIQNCYIVSQFSK